jgi:hypothetical protein
MKLQEALPTIIILLILSILFVPIDRIDIVAGIISISAVLGIVYGWIKK